MEPMQDFAQLQLHFVDQIQWRYELIRPLVLLADGTPAQRAADTHTHPDTVRTFTRRFHQQGMLGLLPGSLEVVPRGRAPQVPEAVRQEIARLKGLYAGFHYRELARILFATLHYRIDHKTVKQLWQQTPVTTSPQLELWDYHTHPDRSQARWQAIQLYYQGWHKVSISRFLHVSRPTVDLWIARFEEEHMAGLVDHKPGPKSPRKVWFAVMVEVYHLQKRHPDAGEFRIWSLLARPDLSVRTIGRIMALNRRVYDDIPHGRKPAPTKDPRPHPFKAQRPHQYWFIDGRIMDFALDGIKWWSLIILDGYSRTMLAGAVAPTEASWVALTVLYSACLHYGAPEHLISDSGGAYISEDFEAVCRRLEIDHQTIVSTQGESYKNLMETHFNIQRRLFDYQFSLTQTPAEFEQVHQLFMQTYNTTAHQGLLKDKLAPPIPLQVLGAAKGRFYTPDELARKFSRALFPRTTNPYGCVTLHSYHFYVEEGLPQTQVLLWVYGEQLRAMLDNVILAEYRCRYDWRTHKVHDIREGSFYPTRFAPPQGALLPLNPQEFLVLYRPQAGRYPARKPFPYQQLLLFERVRPA
jgi:transposase InsO family protein